jgi:hypothetical protein
MSFDFRREYNVHLLLGAPTAPPLWQRDRWAAFFPMLQSLARCARGGAVTSSTQFEASGRKTVKFGRIGWTPEAQTKWTHTAETPHRFLSTEVWVPSRGACDKDGKPPDLLFVLWNQGYFVKESTFRDTVLIAVPWEDAVAVQKCAEVAQRLSVMVQAKFHGRMKRPWGKPWGTIGYEQPLGVMPTGGLFRAGPHHMEEPGNGILIEKWDPVLRVE